MGHIAAMVTVTFWSFTFVAVSILLRVFTPFEIILIRFSLAIAMLYLLYPKRMPKTTWRTELLFAGAGLTGVTIFFLLQDFALLNTSASNAGVIVAISPVFTATFAWWFSGEERPKTTFFLGALLAICGIALISFAGTRLELNPLGDLLALMAAVCWGFYNVFTKKLSIFGYHVIQTTRRVFVYGLLFLIPVTFLAGDVRLGMERFAEPWNVAALFFLGLIASALCFVLWNFAVTQIGPTKTSIYVFFSPIITVLSSVLILGDALTPMKLSGIALVLSGLAIAKQLLGRRAAGGTKTH